MLKRDVVRSVRKSWAFLKERGLGELVRDYEPLAVNDEFRKMALGGARNYVELYLSALTTLSYNIMLQDFSILQYSWVAEEDVRYGFLPNPMLRYAGVGVTLDIWENVSTGITTVEEAMQELSEVDHESGVPPIRYENSATQHKPFRHPCSHFHVGFDSENRWPLQRLLTPFAFTLLITKLYFPGCWLADCGATEISSFEEILITERRENCRILPPGLFSTREGESFHVA